MHAFITGATGFLGRHLVEQLLLQGWKITALCRDMGSAYTCEQGAITWKQGNLNDIQSLRCAMPEAVDAVFHLASDTSTWSLNHRRQYQTNVIGTQNLAKVALENRAIRFIHTSSIAVYGFHDGAVDEHSEMRGMDCPVPYFRSKYLAEEVIREYIKKGLDAVILNPTAIIGPYDTQNWVRLFDVIRQSSIPGVPPGRKSFCYAEDVAKAHIQAFIHGRCAENYILSGPDADFTYVYQWLGKRLNQSPPTRVLPSWLLKTYGLGQTIFSHITRKEPKFSLETAYIVSANVTADSDKARRELQYKNHFTLDEMLEKTYQWWLSQHQQATSTKLKDVA
ncbi:MAG: SDR family oxidoreductase [Gammaproteobacteria bacterium]|nr:SDR family oxidoreductase [Gammaproteobacteria bacterium]